MSTITRRDAPALAPAPDVEAILFGFAGDGEAGLVLRGERRPDGTWRVAIRRARDGGPERDVALPAEVAAALMGAVQGVLAAAE